MKSFDKYIDEISLLIIIIYINMNGRYNPFNETMHALWMNFLSKQYLSVKPRYFSTSMLIADMNS